MWANYVLQTWTGLPWWIKTILAQQKIKEMKWTLLLESMGTYELMKKSGDKSGHKQQHWPGDNNHERKCCQRWHFRWSFCCWSYHLLFYLAFPLLLLHLPILLSFQVLSKSRGWTVLEMWTLLASCHVNPSFDLNSSSLNLWYFILHLGFTKVSTFGPAITNLGCSSAIFFDDLLNGNVTSNGSSFFTGLNTLHT